MWENKTFCAIHHPSIRKQNKQKGSRIFCRFFFGMDRYKNEKPKKQKKKSRGGTVLAGGWLVVV
jgi:hypothetical protein